MIIAQISDFHLRTDGRLLKGLLDSQAALGNAIEHLLALDPPPDVVLATGDLVQKAHKRDYEGLLEQLDRLPMPLYAIPGNHDDKAMMQNAFAHKGFFPENAPFLHYTVEGFALRLIGLDTIDAGRDNGRMCAQRLDWLEARLSEEPHRPTLIFMHHPPFKTAIAFMDADAFEGAAAMEAIVARHPQVERVICGHMHRPITLRWGGTVASVSPGIIFQMVLDLKKDAPSGFVLEPPAISLYVWEPDTGLIGHTSLIGDFGPRHPFVADPL